MWQLTSGISHWSLYKTYVMDMLCHFLQSERGVGGVEGEDDVTILMRHFECCWVYLVNRNQGVVDCWIDTTLSLIIIIECSLCHLWTLTSYHYNIFHGTTLVFIVQECWIAPWMNVSMCSNVMWELFHALRNLGDKGNNMSGCRNG